jgi:hypothetical protein
LLTDLLQIKLQNPATSPEFDFHGAVEQVLADVGLTARDSGVKLTAVAAVALMLLWIAMPETRDANNNSRHDGGGLLQSERSTALLRLQ